MMRSSWVICGLTVLLAVSSSLAQEEDSPTAEAAPAESYPTSHIYQEPTPEPSQASPEDADMADIEAIEKARAQQAKSAPAQIGQQVDQGLNNTVKGVEDLKSMGDIMDPKFRAELIKALKANPAAMMPPEMMRDMLYTRFKGTGLQKLFDKFPRSLDWMVEIVRSPDVIPSMLGILDRQDDVKTFGIISLFTFVIFLFLKSKLVPKEGFLKRFTAKMLWNLGYFVLVWGLFYNMFDKELGPFVTITAKYIVG